MSPIADKKILLCDTRQQADKHRLKNKWFAENGIMVNRCALVCGDYQLAGDGHIAVDSKQGCSEVINDIQVKTITKAAVGDAVREICDRYNIGDGFDKEMYHVITDDDSNRYPEAQIMDLCVLRGLPDEASKRFQELYVKRHGFFHRGLIRAKQYGVKLYILVEEPGIHSIRDVFRWRNPRLDIYVRGREIIGINRNGSPKYKRVQKYPNACTGSQLAKAMNTIEKKYAPVEFVFCDPKDAGRMIMKILEGRYEEEGAS